MSIKAALNTVNGRTIHQYPESDEERSCSEVITRMERKDGKTIPWEAQKHKEAWRLQLGWEHLIVNTLVKRAVNQGIKTKRRCSLIAFLLASL